MWPSSRPFLPEPMSVAPLTPTQCFPHKPTRAMPLCAQFKTRTSIINASAIRDWEEAVDIFLEAMDEASSPHSKEPHDRKEGSSGESYDEESADLFGLQPRAPIQDLPYTLAALIDTGADLDAMVRLPRAGLDKLLLLIKTAQRHREFVLDFVFATSMLFKLAAHGTDVEVAVRFFRMLKSRDVGSTLECLLCLRTRCV